MDEAKGDGCNEVMEGEAIMNAIQVISATWVFFIVLWVQFLTSIERCEDHVLCRDMTNFATFVTCILAPLVTLYLLLSSL